MEKLEVLSFKVIDVDEFSYKVILNCGNGRCLPLIVENDIVNKDYLIEKTVLGGSFFERVLSQRIIDSFVRLEVVKGRILKKEGIEAECRVSISKLYYLKKKGKEGANTVFELEEFLELLITCLKFKVPIFINEALLVDSIEGSKEIVSERKQVQEINQPLDEETRALLEGLGEIGLINQSKDFKNNANHLN